MTPTDTLLHQVILEAYRRSFSVSSNFARENAAVVAMASSLNLITTNVTKNIFSSEWRPTARGLSYLSEADLEDTEECSS